jgi:hypothetical protein
MNKNRELLDEFIAYCDAHPEMRFWQALRNWCGWNFVWVSTRGVTDEPDLRDTFYWEKNTRV